MNTKYYYAISKGRKVGIVETWEECEKSVSSYAGAKYKRFSSYEQAEEWLKKQKLPVAPFIRNELGVEIGKKIEINPEHTKTPKIMGRKSVTCRDTGETVTTYEAYLQTKHWKTLREAVYEKYDRTCVYCGDVIPLTLANVHHRTYKRLGHESMRDLVLYCDRCHRKVHNSKKRAKNKAKAEKQKKNVGGGSNFINYMHRLDKNLLPSEKDALIAYCMKKYGITP